MKSFFLILFLFPFLTVFSQVPLEELRDCQEKVKDDEDYAENLIKRLKAIQNLSTLQEGYLGLVEAMMAEHAFNPMKKLSYFNNGKDRLESAIKKKNGSVELRYLRLGIQLNVPSILGYSDSIDKDKGYILNNISAQKQDLGTLHPKIIDFMIDSGLCSDSEIKALKKLN